MRLHSATVVLAGILITSSAAADTLRLRSGQVIEGTFLQADTRQVKFLGQEGRPKIYSLNEVAGVTFAENVPTAMAPSPQPVSKPTRATVLAGTLIAVRMVDNLDTKTTQTGQLFTATLDSNLVANGVVVARRGATVHGKVVKSENARRLTGRSEMQLELRDIVINGTAHPIRTSGFQQKGKSEGAQTAKKTVAGAGLGAAIGAISGNAGKGAAIGAVSGLGVSMIKKGEPIQFPPETLLEFSLEQPTTLPVAR
jgi:hypothetical protein